MSIKIIKQDIANYDAVSNDIDAIRFGSKLKRRDFMRNEASALILEDIDINAVPGHCASDVMGPPCVIELR